MGSLKLDSQVHKAIIHQFQGLWETPYLGSSESFITLETQRQAPQIGTERIFFKHHKKTGLSYPRMLSHDSKLSMTRKNL